MLKKIDEWKPNNRPNKWGELPEIRQTGHVSR